MMAFSISWLDSIPWLDILTIVGALLLVVSVIVFWLLNFISLPGNWMLIGVVIIYAILVPHENRLAIGWPVVVVLIALGAFGELVEFATAALGATRAGGSRWGAALALIGSLVGGLVGLVVGAAIPPPVVGPVVAALVFAGFGAMIGAMIGEMLVGRNLQESLQVGHAAFWGRLLGTLGKIGVGAAMAALVICSTMLKTI